MKQEEIKCSKCKRRINSLTDYLVDWYQFDDKEGHFYICKECIDSVPDVEPKPGCCDFCGSFSKKKTNTIEFDNLNTGKVYKRYVLCKDCFTELFKNLHLASFLNG